MTVKGVDQTLRNLNRAGGLLENASKSAAEAVGQDVRTNAIKLIREQSAGEIVTRYTGTGGSYSHTVSKPGDAPNTDTGRLMNSINVWPEGKNTRVGTDVIYGLYLEFGTQNKDGSEKMAARPYFVPAKEMSEKKKDRILQNAIDRELEKL